MSELPPEPAVSVIVAIKNAERFLRQALDSIAAQSFEDYEIVVVDGDSTDNGPAIARAFPKATCIPQNSVGFAQAWNVGFGASRGQFICFLDSDDLWPSDKLARQMDAFRREPSLEYVHGRVQFFLEPGSALPRGFRKEILDGSRLGHFPGAAMIRRCAIERLGPFEDRFRIAGDIAWFAELRDTSVTGALDDIVLMKRLHADNLGHTTSSNLLKSEILQILKDRADRWRLRQAQAPAPGASS